MINQNNKQIDNMQETITKAIGLFPSFSVKDKMLFFLAYSEFVETVDNIVSKYDGRKYRMAELINELNNLSIKDEDNENG